MDSRCSAPDFPPYRLAGAALELNADSVPWDRDAFGYPVAQISHLRVGDWEEALACLPDFRGWLDAHGVRLVSCRLPHRMLRESMLLEEMGFRFVEMVYSPRLAPLPEYPAGAGIALAPAVEGDLAAIRAIAESAFSTGRYLLDWRLPAELSHRRYGRWVLNSFSDPRHEVVKATRDGEIVAFAVWERRGDGGIYWHLTAVAPAWQGQGIGRAFWTAMLAANARAGAGYVETTISAHNPAVMNLYARLGFAFQPPSMTFHWLRGGPGP